MAMLGKTRRTTEEGLSNHKRQSKANVKQLKSVTEFSQKPLRGSSFKKDGEQN